MLDAIAYRGPDGTGCLVAGAIGLGYAKLAITPEEAHEQQPLVSPRTGCVVVADVRLDNRAELLARLSARLPATTSDAELILQAYETWGVDAPTRLLGDFAFIVWDPRHQRLVAARDTSGQRWLYYRADERTFAAGTEIHQLFQDPAVPVVPNEASIRHLLVPYTMFRNEKERPETYYEGVYSVQAGHTLVVEQQAVRERRYWQLEPQGELRYRTADEYAEHFRALFFDAVRARLRSAGPVGVMLSGGMDSSSIACSAQELYRAGQAADHGFQSFSLVFDGLECDERGLIADVVAKYGFQANYLPHAAHIGWLRPEPSSFQPSPTTRISEVHAVYAAAHQAGVRVLLTGDMADAAVRGGWLVFDSLLCHGRLRDFWRYLRAYRRVGEGEPWRKTLGLYCLLPLLPISAQKPILLPRIRRDLESVRHLLLPGWMPETLRAELAYRHIQLTLREHAGRRFRNWMREIEYRQLYPPEIARNPVGWPLEICRPYADRRLHEFLLAIPPEEKFDPPPDTDSYYAAQKQIVRRAMRGIQPESVRTRSTPTHFGSVFSDEVKRRWPLYESIFGPWGRSEIGARGYVDAGKFWERLQQLRTDEGYDSDFMYITRMALLETWLRATRQPRPQLVTVPAFWGAQPMAGADAAHPLALAGQG